MVEPPGATPLRVFVSYSWDSPEHKQRVLQLAQRLRGDGIDAWLDRFTTFPEEGWPRWMEREIARARYVLIVATAKYAERFAGTAPAGIGLGATWEGAIITQDLYDAATRNEKFLPVLLSAADGSHVPKPLRSFSRFRVDTEDGYTALYRQITGQPEILPAPLGDVRRLPGGPASAPALPTPEVHDHAAMRSNLPRLPWFFGREEELERVTSSLAPDARTWGALIDGPGGIGKTALAIRAAELTPTGQFRRAIFLSAKSRELTPDGERALSGFVLPGYLEMLNELARQIDQPELTKADESDRPSLLQRALQTEHALLILDNLESLPADDRDRLFEFLSRLPRGCKAIVTSRRRADVDARLVRLDKLGQDAALEFIAELARDRPLLARATPEEHLDLYENTGGNPLLIRWVAGQLGRGSYRTLTAALALLRSAPAGNDPLEFVFGDLADTFTATETKVLAAVSYFTNPVPAKFIAEVADVSDAAAQAALDDLTDRALIASDAEALRFALMPLVADFLRRARPEAVSGAGNRLADRAYALTLENGHDHHDRFPVLEDAWSTVAAALPLFLKGANDRLQTLCAALNTFLDFSGRWDEALSLNSQAEERAVAMKDFSKAGWRAHRMGYIHFLRGRSGDVFACADRAAGHWREANAGTLERSEVVHLRGLAHGQAGHRLAAVAAFREALRMRGADEDRGVTGLLNSLAGAERGAGEHADAERDFNEALRIARKLSYAEGVAVYTGNLALLALDRRDWVTAETQSREALAMAETLGNKDLVGLTCGTLATALVRQNRRSEAVPLAKRAVHVFTELRSNRLNGALSILRDSET